MASYDNKVLTGDQLVYFSSLVKTALAGKADSADIPDVSGKQDALVFNTAYDASTNKVATMSDIPTVPSNVSELTNDSGFQTASQVQTAINTALGGSSSFSFEIVQSLPQSDISTSKIYLVAKQTSGTNQVYTEYAYVNNGWEIIGDTSMTIDTLSNAEVQTIWNAASAT